MKTARAFAYLLISLCISSVQAKIYTYTDNAGVVHFSNRPQSGQYWQSLRSELEKQNTVSDAGPIISVNHYDPLIRKASKQNTVSFALVKAVIKAESNFQANAVSPAGALGLMQIMPNNLKSLNISNPFDPAENIMGGSLYLKQLLLQFEDNLPLALAAYNAGPMAVMEHANIPPYRETQHYVKRVLVFYKQYQKAGLLATKGD